MPPDRPVRSVSAGGSPLPAPAVPEVRMKPRLRGVLHQYAFFVSLASGTLLVLLATTPRASLAAAIYAALVSALFGVSALYHRISWTTPARRRMRRLDHAMIFLLIAGTYTPVGLLVLRGTLARVVLAVVWGGAAAGIVLELAWTRLPGGWAGRCIWLLAGWRWWPCRSCSCAAPTRCRPGSATTSVPSAGHRPVRPAQRVNGHAGLEVGDG